MTPLLVIPKIGIASAIAPTDKDDGDDDNNRNVTDYSPDGDDDFDDESNNGDVDCTNNAMDEGDDVLMFLTGTKTVLDNRKDDRK